MKPRNLLLRLATLLVVVSLLAFNGPAIQIAQASPAGAAPVACGWGNNSVGQAAPPADLTDVTAISAGARLG